jgi:type I restriction enzyme S subunit
VSGSEIKTKEQQVCKAGELLVAEIDAKLGGYGLVPNELDGSIVSSHYFLFSINEERLDRDFLRWYLKTPNFFAQVSAQGSTNYAAIRPHHVLTYTIPLPSISDQRRVVQQLNAVAARVNDRELAATTIEAELSATLSTAFKKITAGAPRARMGEVAPLVRRPIRLEPDMLYKELGVRSFGRGLFGKPPLKGADLTWQKLFGIEAGDLVFSNIKAWEGAFAVARSQDDGKVGSHRYLTCVPYPNKATANFLWYYLQTREGLEQVQAASPGSADRNRTLSQKGLEEIKLPVPSIDDQRWFDALQAKVAAARAHSVEAAKELDRLIPAILNRIFSSALGPARADPADER